MNHKDKNQKTLCFDNDAVNAILIEFTTYYTRWDIYNILTLLVTLYSSFLSRFHQKNYLLHSLYIDDICSWQFHFAYSLQ